MELTVRHKTEARNILCAHIKRDDQISRRLVLYLVMQRHKLVLLVRDAESGKILVTPPEDQTWLFRERNALAAKNDWNVVKRIGPKFFEEMDAYREWRFSFSEYYDVYIWDLEVGKAFAQLYNLVHEVKVSLRWSLSLLMSS
jgi:hypothetical protein